MKLITLNTWGGKIYQPLLEFISKNEDVDIFCFQEVFSHTTPEVRPPKKEWINIYKEICNTLAEFRGFFAPAQRPASPAAPCSDGKCLY